MSTLRNTLRRLLHGLSDDIALAPVEETIVIPVAASADASTAVAATAPYVVPYDCDLIAARYAGAASAASDASNYATLTLTKRTAASAGTVSTAVASLTTSTAAGDLKANVGAALPVTSSLAALKANDTLTHAITKTGTGVSTAAGTLSLRVRRV